MHNHPLKRIKKIAAPHVFPNIPKHLQTSLAPTKQPQSKEIPILQKQGHVMVFNLVSFVSSTTCRPINYRSSCYCGKISRGVAFAIFRGETWSRRWLVGGIAKQRHACTKSIFDSNHLWTSLCCSTPKEWNGQGIATICPLLEFQQWWLLVSSMFSTFEWAVVFDV